MKACLALALLFAACSTEVSIGNTTPTAGRVQVALLPQSLERDVDLLFVIDDSPRSTSTMQDTLVMGFPAFMQLLSSLQMGMPNLHIGVVSSDLGTKGALDPAPGPGLGSGPGSCYDVGKNAMLTSSSVISGNFIRDVDAGDGTRSTNYSVALTDAFSSIARLGEAGCGFEQPLQAANLAFTQPANAGFVRDEAALAVIVVTNEDDCSIARSEFLGTGQEMGPMQSFRCTRFGVTCDDGGRTTDDMNEVGRKVRCQANESLAYLTSVADTAAAIKSLKADARNVLFAAIAGEASSLEVELREPPGGGTPVPALKRTCVTDRGGFVYELDPAVRITDHASAYPRSRVQTDCSADTGRALLEVGREIRNLLGDACLTRDIKLPADCEAFDTFADGTTRHLAECNASATSDCYHLVEDPGCPGQGQRLHVSRFAPPPADAMVSLRCKL